MCLGMPHCELLTTHCWITAEECRRNLPMSEMYRKFPDGREPSVNNKESLSVGKNSFQWYPPLKNALNSNYRLLLNSV